VNKRLFRKAYTKAKMTMIFGLESSERDLSPLETLAGKFFMKMSQQYDPLVARLSGFTPSARSRITNYPIRLIGKTREKS
jgi:hypothetical protein